MGAGGEGGRGTWVGKMQVDFQGRVMCDFNNE